MNNQEKTFTTASCTPENEIKDSSLEGTENKVDTLSGEKDLYTIKFNFDINNKLQIRMKIVPHFPK